MSSEENIYSQVKDSNKYLGSIVRCEDVIESLNSYLAFKKVASIHFYPTQIEEIMDLLIDMRSIIQDYSRAFNEIDEMYESEKKKSEQWDELFKPQ